MLSIASVSSQHAAHYYGADNYCSPDEAKTASQWTGNGFDALQLDGPVENQIFSTLLNGYTPDGKQLHQAFKMHHVAGIDLTFSAPNDAQRFETLGAQARQEMLRAQRSHSPPSHEVSR